MNLVSKVSFAGVMISMLSGLQACGDKQDSRLFDGTVSERWSRGELEFVRVTETGPAHTNVISLTIERPDSTWRVVSGGGAVKYNGPGMLLTGSYPVDSQGSAWKVEAKAHVHADSGYIEGAAVFVRKKDGTRISDSDYLVTSRPSGLSLTPTSSVSLPAGFSLLSGGALIENNLPGGGQLLTGSYPEGNSWIAKSKAHDVAVAKSLRAYAVGLKSTFLDASRIEVFSLSSELIGSVPERSCNTEHGFDVVGGGAEIQHGQSAPGILLTASYPSGQNSWFAAGKAHIYHDNKNLKVFCTGVKDK
jgi:hypothetical protein